MVVGCASQNRSQRRANCDSISTPTMLIQNMRPDTSFPEDLEGEVFFPLFDKTITVSGFRPDNIEYANACAKLLMELDDNMIKQLCFASIRYCNAFLEAVGE